ncbi:MAG: hypothetical protein ACI82A_003491 [Candidatus Azotimanducaceae bacterium]
MHDTVWFEINGIPSVSVASEEFVDAADTQARALGMVDAERVFVAHPIQDATDDQMREKADAVVEAVISALTNQTHTA